MEFNDIDRNTQGDFPGFKTLHQELMFLTIRIVTMARNRLNQRPVTVSEKTVSIGVLAENHQIVFAFVNRNETEGIRSEEEITKAAQIEKQRGRKDEKGFLFSIQLHKE